MDKRDLIPGRDRKFSLHHRIQTGSGAYPPSYQMGTGALSKGVKQRGRKLTIHIHKSPV
jgi:hypothetical protein